MNTTTAPAAGYVAMCIDFGGHGYVKHTFRHGNKAKYTSNREEAKVFTTSAAADRAAAANGINDYVVVALTDIDTVVAAGSNCEYPGTQVWWNPARTGWVLRPVR